MDFDYYDILGDDEVRQGLKAYSNWPTFPQLYANGELLGGLDIVKVRPPLSNTLKGHPPMRGHQPIVSTIAPIYYEIFPRFQEMRESGELAEALQA